MHIAIFTSLLGKHALHIVFFRRIVILLCSGCIDVVIVFFDEQALPTFCHVIQSAVPLHATIRVSQSFVKSIHVMLVVEGICFLEVQLE